MSDSYLAAVADRTAAALQTHARAVDDFSDLGFRPDDGYDYSQHLKCIGSDGVLVSRKGPVDQTEEMDDELMAALSLDAEALDDEDAAADETFLDALVDAR
jgi:hypothetical protein